MSLLKNIRIATLVLAGFAAAFALMAVQVVVSWTASGKVSSLLGEVTTSHLQAYQSLSSAYAGQNAGQGCLAGLMFERDPQRREAYVTDAADGIEQVQTAVKELDGLPRSGVEAEHWKALKAALEQWVTAARDQLSLESQRQGAGDAAVAERALAGIEICRDLDQRVDLVFDQVVKDLDARTSAVRGESARLGTGLRSALLVALLACAALLAGAALAISGRIRRTVRGLVDETGRLSAAVARGQLDVRGEAGAVGVEFRPVVLGMNAVMDAYERPVRAAMDTVSSLGEGRLPPRIAEAFQGDFERLRESLNACIGAVEALIEDSAMLARAGVAGQLSTRADASRHQGDFRKVVEGVNDTLDAVVGPLTVAASYVDQISRGRIPARITTRSAGDFDALQQNLNRCIDAVNALVADADGLAEAAVAGKLSTRADASRHEGDFRKIVDGVNRTLDAVIGPLEVAARCVDDIARGAIPPRITDRYAGDFNKLKDNLNTCIDAVNRLVADADGLVQAAVAGRLSTRADAGKHQGDFRKVVDGVNRTLDAVMAPIGEASATLERLAARDLRARVSGEFQGDHARIKDAVNATGQALHDALAQVAEAVEQVTGASQQIASSSQAVASGASEQASSLQETSGSMETVSALTRQAADNAVQANTLARTARGAATEGAGAVEQMQGAMAKIRASAESTSQIIRDINDIAFQTNLLALNAAVEAARAGEAGRGFAVVAEEVRSLALRAKEAAQKTEELIRESVKQAGEGEQTARQVAGKLGEIVGGIGKVTDIVSEIASSAKEQTSGIDQVGRAVDEMNRVTQQNAASAEESSSAASELSGQAEELAAMVASFQLARSGGTNGRARRPAQLPAARQADAPAPAGRKANGKPAGELVFPMDDATDLREF